MMSFEAKLIGLLLEVELDCNCLASQHLITHKIGLNHTVCNMNTHT